MLLYLVGSVCLIIIANKTNKGKIRKNGRQELSNKILFIKKIDELAMNIP